MSIFRSLRISLVLPGLVFFLGISPGPLQAQDCLDYSSYPHILAAAPTEDSARILRLDGNFAYVGSTTHVEIFDVSNPGEPALVGSKYLYPFMDFAVSGNHMYVVNQIYEDPVGNEIYFRSYDVSDPSDPQLECYLDTPLRESTYAVAVSGSYVYLGRYVFIDDQGEFTIDVLDVAAPASPQIVASMFLGYLPRGMTVKSGFLYVTSEYGGLQIVDVSNPLSPTIVGQHPGAATAVEVVGDLACVARGADGLEIVDVADPADPATVSLTATPGICTNLSVLGDRVYVAGSTEGIAVVDISNPSHPDVVYSAVPGTVRDVQATGDHIFTAAGQSIQVLALPNYQSPDLVGSLSTLDDVSRMDIAGDLICLGDDEGTIFSHDYKLRAIDVSAPGRPRVVDTLDMAGSINDVRIEGGVAYIASSTGGLVTVDLSDPARLQLLGQVDPTGSDLSVAVAGPVAYLVGALGDLHTVDISDPADPRVLGSVSLGSHELWDVEVSGDHAYVAEPYTGVRAVDVSDPANPQLVGTVPLSGNTTEVCVAGGNLLVGNEDQGLLVYDLLDPAAPAFLGSLPTGDVIRHIRSSGDYAYLANAGAGLLIVDFTSTPSSPRPVGWCNSIGYGNSVAVGDGNYFVVSETELQVLPLPCPAASPVTPTVGPGLLLAICPNPFNPATTISFDLAAPARVELEVFDMRGRRVRTLVSGWMQAGPHRVLWQGRDREGRPAASGVYFCRLEADGRRLVERMTLLK